MRQVQKQETLLIAVQAAQRGLHPVLPQLHTQPLSALKPLCDLPWRAFTVNAVDKTRAAASMVPGQGFSDAPALVLCTNMQRGTSSESFALCQERADLHCPVGLQLAYSQLRQVAHYLCRVGIHLPWLGVIHTPACAVCFSELMQPTQSRVRRHHADMRQATSVSGDAHVVGGKHNKRVAVHMGRARASQHAETVAVAGNQRSTNVEADACIPSHKAAALKPARQHRVSICSLKLALSAMTATLTSPGWACTMQASGGAVTHHAAEVCMRAAAASRQAWIHAVNWQRQTPLA